MVAIVTSGLSIVTSTSTFIRLQPNFPRGKVVSYRLNKALNALVIYLNLQMKQTH